MINACCEKPENLELRPPPEPAPEGLEMRVCRECGNRHFELTVDPIKLGLKFT
jgi:hypothetical protein